MNSIVIWQNIGMAALVAILCIALLTGLLDNIAGTHTSQTGIMLTK
jgi:hypothetical protein